ncbi:uncharacterized protein PHACADRAFT_201302 [Phanerochaete carnosa HHB-10118-sp]|uniref:GATA-type domain-containing protein n=1 Tax=Phanerochaete carnosa (strain HHB-10118-sp) TaxID=650164 RepID=K5UJ49_PHACS|nr:uncharacterized protein PHACADRAFT_201302 [Phanerochaete carnosa HHB-10118-sp]EKM49591.1 hypothetical protein PHACADRAFT_201302 [Phanerochaete carnosa HHB-10118-sp]
MIYGEGLNTNTHSSSDKFSIPHPTIELSLDKTLNAGNPDGCFTSQKEDMKPATNNAQVTASAPTYDDHPHENESMLLSTNALRAVLHVVENLVPWTIMPCHLGLNPVASTTPLNGKWPLLSLCTANRSRSSGPGVMPVNSTTNTTSSAPGGVKAKCSNCGINPHSAVVSRSQQRAQLQHLRALLQATQMLLS